jgi:hypothetical protein
MDRNDASFKFLERKMVRERNRVAMPHGAIELIEQTLREVLV